MAKNLILLSFLIVILLSGCNDKNYDLTESNYGNNSRNNSFEFLKEFYSSEVNSVEFEKEQKYGSLAPALPLKDGSLIIATTDNHIKKVNLSSKEIMWSVFTDSNSVVSNPICSDSLGNIYAIDFNGKLFCISSEGKLNWKYGYPNNDKVTLYSYPLALANGVVIGTSKGDIIKFDSKGKILWTYKSSLAMSKSFSMDNNGNLIFNLTNNQPYKTDSLLVLSSKGEKVFSKGFENIRLVNNPLFSKDGYISSGIYQKDDFHGGVVIKTDKQGNILWRKEMNLLPRHLSLAENGDLFLITYSSDIGESTSGIICYDSTGNLKWKMYYDYSIPSPALLTKKQIAFTGTNNKTSGLFILDRNNGKLQQTINLGDYPDLVLLPIIDANFSMILPTKSGLNFVKITQSMFDKMIPF